MKRGYLVTSNITAAAVLRKRLMEQGAEEITVDNNEHEHLNEFLDSLIPGDSLYIWNLFHLSKNSQTVRDVLQRLTDSNIMFFIDGERVDLANPYVKMGLVEVIDDHDKTMQEIKPRVEYFEKVVQDERAQAEKARNPFKALRQQSKMQIGAFAEYFHIPQRTIEAWEDGKYRCSEYLLELMHYKLKKERIIK